MYEHLAILCINICRVVDPQVIILAGGMALAGEKFRKRLEEEIHYLSWKVLKTNIKIVLATNIEHVGIIGAAMAYKTMYSDHLPKESTILIKDPKWLLAEQSCSNVENTFIQQSNLLPIYTATEKILSIEVENVYELGLLVTLRFLEWISLNQTGVIALPTGRTPEYFIKTLERLKSTWNDVNTQN
jgi:hypothetical protein